jgi:hypothetical protein
MLNQPLRNSKPATNGEIRPVPRADFLELDRRRGKRQLRKTGNAAHHAIHRGPPTARKDHLSRQCRSFIFAGQPCRLARHEPAHCIVVDDQVPEPDPIASFPVTVATWPKRWNAKSTMPRRLIWSSTATSSLVLPAKCFRHDAVDSRFAGFLGEPQPYRISTHMVHDRIGAV